MAENAVSNEELDPTADFMYCVKLPSGREFYCFDSGRHEDGIYLASVNTGEWLDISYADLPVLIERLQNELNERAENEAINTELAKLARWNAAQRSTEGARQALRGGEGE